MLQFCIAALGMTLCPAIAAEKERPVVEALRTGEPVIIDGRLDDPVWQRAPRYSLHKSIERAADRPRGKVDPGYVQFAWDDEYFYLAARFTDRDVQAWSDEDQRHHYNLGDVCELFLKPRDSTWYWEMYVTPKGNKTLFWFPGAGLLRHPSNFQHDPTPLRVAAQVQGTLNDWSDEDEGWTAEMAVPISLLTDHGDVFEPGAGWLVLVGRYNHSRYGEHHGPQLTSYPKIPGGSFHDSANYANLQLVE